MERLDIIMNHNTTHTTIKLAALALLGALGSTCGVAHAQSAGSWLVRAGVTTIASDVKSGTLSAPSVPDVRIDVNTVSTLGGGVSYMVTDHWSVDLPLALPFKSHIRGAGAIAGSGDIATTKVVPATLFLQYRFLEASARWRPYLGIGPTYAHFYDETGNGTLTGITNPGGAGTTLKIKDKWGVTYQVGATYEFTPRFFVDAMIGQTQLKVRTTLSTGQTINARLNPLSTGLYLGYRF